MRYAGRAAARPAAAAASRAVSSRRQPATSQRHARAALSPGACRGSTRRGVRHDQEHQCGVHGVPGRCPGTPCTSHRAPVMAYTASGAPRGRLPGSWLRAVRGTQRMNVRAIARTFTRTRTRARDVPRPRHIVRCSFRPLPPAGGDSRLLVRTRRTMCTRGCACTSRAAVAARDRARVRAHDHPPLVRRT